jgi:hypothetical protein
LSTSGWSGTGRQDDSVFVFPIRFRTQDLRTLTSIALILRSDHVSAIISDLRRPWPCHAQRVVVLTAEIQKTAARRLELASMCLSTSFRVCPRLFYLWLLRMAGITEICLHARRRIPSSTVLLFQWNFEKDSSALAWGRSHLQFTTKQSRPLAHACQPEAAV